MRRHLSLAAAVLIVVLSAGVFSASSPAEAHLTGVFRHFLQDVEEGTASSAMLEAQIEQTNERLEELQPELEAAQQAYEEAADPARTRVRFYNRFSGNLFGAMLVGADDMVDTLANLYLIQTVIGRDVSQLRDVAQEYEQLRTRERNLRQYRDLLQAIRDVRQRRQEMLDSVPDTEEDRQLLLYDTAEDWETMREEDFTEYFEWTTERLQQIAGVAEPTPTGSWRVTQERWNELLTGGDAPVEEGRFYLRADHIYFSGYMEAPRAERRHIFTVGLMSRVDADTIEYRLDAIYVDGFPVDPSDPDVESDIYQRDLMVIEGSELDGGVEQLLFNQENGSLELITRP